MYFKLHERKDTLLNKEVIYKKAKQTKLLLSVFRQEIKLDNKLSKNLKVINAFLNDSEDVKVRHFKFGKNQKYQVCAVFIDGLVDSEAITKSIFQPLFSSTIDSVAENTELINKLNNEILWSSDNKIIKNIAQVLEGCLRGDTVLLIENCNQAILINTKGGEKRAITESASEAVVRGPREGFTENYRTNTALIRRIIKNGDLKVEEITIGEKTKTQVALMYLKGVARSDVVEVVRDRITNIEVESILESGYIEQYIEDHPLSLFATVGYSEKPDTVAGKILEGRVAIVVDGTPFVLTAPMLFVETFQTAEDYYHRPIYTTFIRLVRYVAYFISVFAPGIYIALTNYHQELIPTKLLLSIINAKEGTPFPIFVETLIMVLAFEFLREAGIRLPRSVGQAISIVGALIMGEAAVSAGIVGAPIVIVVAFTAVCTFLLPEQNNSTTILRFCMMICAALGGWFAVSMGLFALLIYLTTLKSFGVPYFDSFSNAYDIKDTFVRLPLWADARRPVNIVGKDKMRTRSTTTIGKKRDIKKRTKGE